VNEGARRWRRDETRELVRLFSLRNELLAALVAERISQRVRQQIRSTAGMSAAAVDTSAPAIGMATATHRRPVGSAAVAGRSRNRDAARAAAPEDHDE
jgi:hypothetical protein